MWSFASHHFATVAGALAAILMMVRLQSVRTSQSTLAWILGFLFLPFVAIPMFLLFGSRKFPLRAKGPSGGPKGWSDEEVAGAPEAARVLRTTGVAPPRNENSFELLSDGIEAFNRLLELIAAAETSIDLTIFILGHDDTGRAIADALAERASKGVQVRVILDAVGCLRSRFYARSKIQTAGGEVRLFMPLTHSPIRGRTNLRSHRKLAVFDRHTIFGGGMNFAEEYMGKGPRPGKNPRWRDLAAVARGPVVRDAEAMFDSDWSFVGGATPIASATASATASASASGSAAEIVQFVPSGPDFVTDTVYDLLLTTLGEARERVLLVTPYYVPDDALQHALVLAARRCVRVELIVPLVSNHGAADIARRSLLVDLAAAGVVIHYYPLGMVHAKAMVVDDSFAYVGSPNFDMRSLFLNYEDALCVYSPGAIAQIRAFAEALIAASTTEGPKGWMPGAIEQLARFLAPEL